MGGGGTGESSGIVGALVVWFGYVFRLEGLLWIYQFLKLKGKKSRK